MDDKIDERFQNALRNSEAWGKLYQFEKEAVLNNLEIGISQRSNRDPAHIKIDSSMSEHDLGEYSYDTKTIRLNDQMVEQNGKETISTLLHEGRHDFQESQIDKYLEEGQHPNQEIVEGWLDYGTSNMSYEEYRNLPAEKDAFAYEEVAERELDYMRDYIHEFDSQNHASNQILETHDMNALEGYQSDFDFGSVIQEYCGNVDSCQVSEQIEGNDLTLDIEAGVSDIAEDFCCDEDISF